MKKTLQFLHKNPEIIFFICAFILWTALMCNENSKEGGDFSWHDIKVEANGMIFDLFVFGILVTVYNAIRARKEKVERLKEEIDDFREWNEKEAKFRIVGVIKRLNKENVSKIDLKRCFLEEAILYEANLQGANLSYCQLRKASLQESVLESALMIESDLSEASFHKANLNNADLKGVKSHNADFRFAKLNNADFWGSNFENSNFYCSELKGAKLRSANFSNVIFSGANLENADLSMADLESADLQRANLKGAILHDANLRNANLEGADLEGAVILLVKHQTGELNAPIPISQNLEPSEIERNWFDILENWGVNGCQEIKAKYKLDEKLRLQLR